MTPDVGPASEPRPRQKRVAVLGSGTGSTARALIEGGLRKGSAYQVELIISTSAKAGINAVASAFAVTLHVLDRSLTTSEWTQHAVELIKAQQIDIVVLAGFMRLLPQDVIEAAHGHVLNIHPALLPNHGGTGMYGRRVHEAVIESGDRSTGATVHLVNERYDEGRILGQTVIDVGIGETAAELEDRVKAAERILYPNILDTYAADLSFDVGNWQQNLRNF